ncbi:MAG: hypothetical protein ACQEVA_20645 [Myxococcota bacterium]
MQTLRPISQAAASVALLVFMLASCTGNASDDDGQSPDSSVDQDASEDVTSDGTTESEDADARDDTSDAEDIEFEETAEDIAAVDAERATPEQIGVSIPLDASLSGYDAASVQYRKRGTRPWREAHPLVRIHPEWIDNDPAPPQEPVEAFAGSIFDLEPATTYDVEITLDDEDGEHEQKTFRRILSTRALPEPAGDATVTATPSDNLQEKVDALGPGDVLELDSGTYEVDTLRIGVSGTESEPIYIRGVSREDVVIENTSGRVIRIHEVSHVIIENLTVRGSGTDSGTDASSRGVSLMGGTDAAFITVRHLDIVGVDMGVVATGPLESTLVYDNDIRGNNGWDDNFVGRTSWNDDGIRLPGRGNCAFENTLDGFGDSFAVKREYFSAGVHFYRNRVNASGDDAFEGDYSTRNVSFYDNYITNTARVVSLDPLWGGPLYAFRNITINTASGPPKWNSKGSGFLVYNNTVVRTDGINNWAYVQYANGALRNFSYRNNVLIFRGSSDNLLAFEPSGIDPVDWTHNAWYPDGSVWWTNSGGSFGSLSDAFDGLPETSPVFGESTRRHDQHVIATSSPFTSDTDPTLGDDYLTEVAHSAAPTPAEDARIRNAGTPIPNITDGYDGSAPEMGAVIHGRPVPQWGANRD